MKMRVLIVIPVYNEASTIVHVIKGCAQYGDVLVVDDGSKDETFFESEKAGAIVLSNQFNRGYEYSLNVGYSYALAQNYDLMITLDGDGQLPSDSIPKFLTAIERGAGLAVGNRASMPRFCEKFLSFSSARLSGLQDPYCGMKAYNLNVMKKGRFSTYNSVGTSLAIDYIELGLICENIDIDVRKREGKSRFGWGVTSEMKLFHSMVIGNVRLLKNWINRMDNKHNEL